MHQHIPSLIHISSPSFSLYITDVRSVNYNKKLIMNTKSTNPAMQNKHHSMLPNSNTKHHFSNSKYFQRTGSVIIAAAIFTGLRLLIENVSNDEQAPNQALNLKCSDADVETAITRELFQTFQWPSQHFGIQPRQALERYMIAGEQRDQVDVATLALSNEDILDQIGKAGVELSHWFLNVGAGDGCIDYKKIECDESNVLLPIKASSTLQKREGNNAVVGSYSGVLVELMDISINAYMIAGEQRDQVDVATLALSNEDILDQIGKAGVELSHWFLNVGAGDGCIDYKKIECDESNVLLPIKASSTLQKREGNNAVVGSYSGVLVELMDISINALKSAYDNAVIINEGVNASSIVQTIRNSAPQLPDDLDLFKMDIDSCDCDIIKAFTSAYHPKVIQAEFNVIYPPPISFNTVDDGTWEFGAHGLSGGETQLANQCSLSHLTNSLEENYILFQVDYWDAWYVTKEVYRALKLPLVYDDYSWYNAGYASKKDRNFFMTKTAYRNGPHHWADLVQTEAMENRPLSKEQQEQMLKEAARFIPLNSQQKKEGIPHPYTLCGK